MEYRIDEFDYLLIYDDKNKLIFGISKNNDWAIYEYDHNSKLIFTQNAHLKSPILYK